MQSISDFLVRKYMFSLSGPSIVCGLRPHPTSLAVDVAFAYALEALLVDLKDGMTRLACLCAYPRSENESTGSRSLHTRRYGIRRLEELRCMQLMFVHKDGPEACREASNMAGLLLLKYPIKMLICGISSCNAFTQLLTCSSYIRGNSPVS